MKRIQIVYQSQTHGARVGNSIDRKFTCGDNSVSTGKSTARLMAARLEALRRHLEAVPGGSDINQSKDSDITAVACAAAAASEGTRFKYTLDPAPGQPPVFTPAQRAFYEENGFIVIRKLVPEVDLDVYRARFHDLCDGLVERSPMMTLMRDGK